MNKCADCGKEITSGSKLGRCASCAKKGNTNGFKAGNTINKGRHPVNEWQKGHGLINGGFSLHKHTTKTKDRIRKTNSNQKQIDKHHIWYEDNDGKPTDRGIMLVAHAHHTQIHHCLKHNRWTDNRRYLAG